MQIGEILKVTAQQRKLIDGLIGKSSTQHVIGRVHDWRFFGNSNGFIDRARVQFEVYADIFCDFQLKPGALRLLETGGFGYRRVRTWLEIGRAVIPFPIGGQGFGEIPVAVFVTVTFAPPTTAPDESVTEPKILP